MSAGTNQTAAGQAVYTSRTLLAYDFVVLGVSNRMIWRCPTSRLLEHYNEHVTCNHLDVGVGSGYFPDRCQFACLSPRIGLLDLNSAALDYAATRIDRYAPETYRHDVLTPLSVDCGGFDSIAINYLIHCLPGTIPTKSVLFDHLTAIMNRGARVFGATILSGGVRRNWLAKRLMNFYNRKGIFSNQSDQLEDLESALQSRFAHVEIKVIGCVALFSGRVR